MTVRIVGSVPMSALREVLRERLRYGKGQHLKKLCVTCGTEKVKDTLNTNMCDACVERTKKTFFTVTKVEEIIETVSEDKDKKVFKFRCDSCGEMFERGRIQKGEEGISCPKCNDSAVELLSVYNSK